MKKALLVSRVSGFVPQFVMHDVSILQDMGYEVHYAADFNKVVYGPDNSRLDGTGIIRHQIDFVKSPFSSKVRKSYQQMCQLLEEEKFDLIHCHMPMSSVIARRAAEYVKKKTGRNVPVLYTAHGFHFYSGAPLKNWMYYPVERHYSKYTDRLILMNKEDFSRGQKFPVRGEVKYVPGVGVPKEVYEKVNNQKQAPDLRKELGLEENISLLACVGELSKRKNHALLLEMMAELKDLDLALVIFGEGDQREYLEQQIKELELEKYVFLKGYEKEVSRYLPQVQLFVFPSLQEGLPMAVMEAMAAGLPVVASRIRGITDLIQHTKGGYLVEGFSPVDYGVKVRRMFVEKEGKSAIPRELRRKEMGLWNQNRVKDFSKEIVEQRMREIYQELLDEK